MTSVEEEENQIVSVEEQPSHVLKIAPGTQFDQYRLGNDCGDQSKELDK